MKNILLAGLLATLLLAGAALTGCKVNQATLEGHDFIDQASANLRTGIDEYHADDAERMRVARKRLVAAFVADVVDVAGDETKVAAKADQFVALLEAAEAAEAVESKRYRNLLNTLRAMAEVNASLRDLAEIKLGWHSDMVEYVGRLRKKVEHGNE